MTYAAFALINTGAIVFRHVRGGKGALADHLRLATGGTVEMPRRVLELAERDGPRAYVPGLRGATDARARNDAIRVFRRQIAARMQP